MGNSFFESVYKEALNARLTEYNLGEFNGSNYYSSLEKIEDLYGDKLTKASVRSVIGGTVSYFGKDALKVSLFGKKEIIWDGSKVQRGLKYAKVVILDNDDYRAEVSIRNRDFEWTGNGLADLYEKFKYLKDNFINDNRRIPINSTLAAEEEQKFATFEDMIR